MERYFQVFGLSAGDSRFNDDLAVGLKDVDGQLPLGFSFAFFEPFGNRGSFPFFQKNRLSVFVFLEKQ
jgi:hypothetical protein